MLTDKKILPKLEKIEERYTELRFEKVADVAMEMWETQEHLRQEPTKAKWRTAPPGTKWGGSWVTAWFQGDVKLPKACHGRQVFIRAKTGGETLFFVDGQAHGVFDGFHPVVLMTRKGIAGRRYHLAFEAYSGHSFPGTQPHDKGIVIHENSRSFDGVEVLLERKDVTAFVFDLRTLRQLVATLDDNSLRKNRVIRGLMQVYDLLDSMPSEASEQSWRPRLAKARNVMQPLLRSPNGPTAPQFGIIGHSHIDTAWLWPLAETWRKCARTFSSMLNLMEQYPEMTFIQSAPCHTDIVRREYPELFKRIQKMAATGRWEPNGGMWVEPDCNIPSGEAFVRQLLVGQTATREMFGYTSDTLWMPDVFGYSAAMPQILRGCDVEFFCTTKISWNDTTRFPYDTFVWKGIDGTPVIAHYNTIHCWPDPQTLTGQWNWVQHKDVQDRRLMAFGFGDGGGGPMAEMMEMARRVQDLEGCPRASYTTVGEFMRGIRDEIAGLPEWSGELYLECHRGTLTSIAKVKRGNRKAELALRDAELLSTVATLRGASYPKQTLAETWKALLTSQFHDILPGSSIKEVNNEAIATFDRCIATAEALSEAALRSVCGASRPKKGTHALVANTLSWDRAGEIALVGVPRGMSPADSAMVSQWVENVVGEPVLLVSGAEVPALGCTLIPLHSKKPARAASPFTVRGDRVETPHAVVRFDRIGRIVSLLDKASGREVVRRGGALNTLLIGEDIPEKWDNWDIDADQRLKMRIEERLVSRKVMADGPLQLRLRSQYHLGSGSRLTQDMVFHTHSPQIDFETVVEWAERHKLLKAAFEIDVLADFARHEIQYGHAERPTHQNLPQDRARFEVCAHKWSDLSENGFGVALLNDCKYGLSVRPGELALSLLKSGTHPDDRGDQGRHRFTYSLLPHACGFSVESVVRPAYELNVPLRMILAGAEAKGFDGLLTVGAPSVIVECVKWAEKGKRLVVRLYEAGKTGTQCDVAFNLPVKAVSETNLLEERPKRVAMRGNVASLSFRAFEIKTLLCEA